VVYYLHGDHLGGTVLTTDGEGRRVGEVRYRPYGTERYRWGSIPTDRRFTGRRWDGEVGLYDYRARWYEPTLGRFVQPDTLVPEPGKPQVLNRYAYVYNNPLRYADPSGYDPLDENWQFEQAGGIRQAYGNLESRADIWLGNRGTMMGWDIRAFGISPGIVIRLWRHNVLSQWP